MQSGALKLGSSLRLELGDEVGFDGLETRKTELSVGVDGDKTFIEFEGGNVIVGDRVL